MSTEFVNGPWDKGSIPGWVIPKTQKMVLDVTLLNTQHYKIKIKGKVERPPLHIGVVVIEKGAFRSPLTKVTNFTLYIELFRSISFFFYIS